MLLPAQSLRLTRVYPHMDNKGKGKILRKN